MCFLKVFFNYTRIDLMCHVNLIVWKTTRITDKNIVWLKKIKIIFFKMLKLQLDWFGLN